MSAEDIPASVLSDVLWLKVINEGVEDRVEVNQRMLIDKMLARYSSDFVVYRELIQNSDDAQATSFHLEITCDTSSTAANFVHISKEQLVNDQQQPTNVFEGIGQLIRNHWGTIKASPTLERNDPPLFSTPAHTSPISEIDFHNSLITEIRTVNNGATFTEVDWKRVATIAEGNTNADAIGQFGVGFFSVFAYSERPMIQSGKHCMAFVWQNGKSLTTFRKELSIDEQSPTTSIILKMRNKYILQTKSTLEMNGMIKTENINGKLNGTKKTKKNDTTNGIVPTMDLTQLKAYFTKGTEIFFFFFSFSIFCLFSVVLSFTKYINELVIKINGLIVFQANKAKKSVPSTKTASAFKKLYSTNEHHLLRFDSFVQTEQTFTIAHGPSITLNHVDVQASVVIDKEFHDQIRRVLKKSLPPTVHIQLLFPSNNILDEQNRHLLANDDLNSRILKSLIPLKFHNDQIIPSGQVFIGLATHQSTGIGMHVFSHLIPTIERENLDLQDPYITIWNEELLVSIGKIARFVYNQAILDGVNTPSQETNQHFDAILAPYAFQTSVPNKEIGRLLVDGFFSSKNDILVPVKRSPSELQLSLVPSSQAFLANSKYIHAFLPVSLVPFDIGKNDFFKILKKHRLIDEIDLATILAQLHESILLSNEFIGLLRWLCSNEINNKSYVKEILSIVRFRETIQSPIIKLEKLEFYDIFNLPSILPLPSNVLPANIAGHLSREELQKRLSLSVLLIKTLVHFYLHENQQHLFRNEITATILLSFISQRWNQLNDSEWTIIKTILSNIRCIPTSQGMKLPNESYIRSSNLSADLSIISLYVPQTTINENGAKNDNGSTDNPVSIEFLKYIGCRTIHVPTLANTQTTHSTLPSASPQTIQMFIEELLKQRKNMSDGDLTALKQRTTLTSSKEAARKHVPCDLHFPSVASRLQWPTLHIIDWYDIDPHSREYAFLKEIGVREVPELYKLIDRIVQEHNDGPKARNEYKLPIALGFLAENFQLYYSKLWKTANIRRAFLPSYCPDVNTEVALSTSDFVFKGSNHFVKPSQVFIRSKSPAVIVSQENNAQLVDDADTRGLIDYIDYGSEANSFLLGIGVLHYPSAENLANLLIDRQATYFARTNDDAGEILSTKLRIYINCLKQLATVSNLAQQLNAEPLSSRLRGNPWCVGFQTIDRSDGGKDRIFKIAKPSDIYLDDDHQCAIDLRPLCAPDEPELTKLYERFGSKWLSESVKRTLVHGGKYTTTDRSGKLRDLIHHRLDMLFVNNRGERMSNVDGKRVELLRTKLSVYEAEGIQCQLTFQNKTVTLNSTECSSCALEHDRNKVALYLHKELPAFDYVDIASELTRFVFKKPLDAVVHAISDKLASPLETLKRRGIPVDRLLKTIEQQPVVPTLQIEHTKQNEPPTQKIQQQNQQQQQQYQQQNQQQPYQYQQQQQQYQQYEQQPLRGLFQSLKE
ncbi:unnamed protein product [Didymodactylos carnosus]|uniref:Uncharacterized protein n=1 Tax=Didymodactylos carnosus TaxID=1234261 RepID=A0A814YVG0_9BILA|nr:unnamed protein product [Didymodactylos carnosus]CAF1235244.1 unnamed protein product [Didymodactylos carnosus]CAF3828696.1 unnamed protein product [Didymodactylos carnosus]CAF3997710.1 unnamed protein product [Didymodactylos carnosus]